MTRPEAGLEKKGSKSYYLAKKFFFSFFLFLFLFFTRFALSMKRTRKEETEEREEKEVAIRKMTPYQSFIHIRTYAKYIEEEGRRENWDETVFRALSWLYANADSKNVLTPQEKAECNFQVLNRDVFPAMRLMWAAGPAADREHATCYNCSFVAINCLEVFSEILYILMCGCGVGFSVQKKYVSQLPKVPNKLRIASLDETIPVVVVADSRKGWALALKEFLMQIFYNATIPDVDYSQVRPAGKRLLTSGGRASGPGALKTLFNWLSALLLKSQGRQLIPAEVHEIICQIAKIVQVGGVRRSALISLSDLNDDQMRDIKSGDWFMEDKKPYLAQSNNSAVYETKPAAITFLREYTATILSMAGERGFFNEQAVRRKMRANGRRLVLDDESIGTNPCSEILLRNMQFCNLTEVRATKDDTEKTLKRKITAAVIIGTLQSTLTKFDSDIFRSQWKFNCERDRLLGVSITGIMDCPLLHTIETTTTPGELQKRLARLRAHCIAVNKELAARLGINQSAAITCVKPSGNVSQLAGCASGIHPTYAPYYIRRVRVSKMDPVYRLIQDQWPAEFIEDNRAKPGDAIISFPIKAPDNVLTTKYLTAVEHFDLWLTYQRHWCEHKPSTTIMVKDDEWPVLGGKIYENFDDMCGVALLPYNDHIYEQAPYEEITESVYYKMIAKCPSDIDWSKLPLYEKDDTTAPAPVLACTGTTCEIE